MLIDDVLSLLTLMQFVSFMGLLKQSMTLYTEIHNERMAYKKNGL